MTKSINGDDCREIVRHYKIVLEHFRKRFINEYSTAVQDRHYHQQRRCTNNKTNIPRSDLVLLKDENKNRVMWQKGKVTKLRERMTLYMELRY